MRMKKFFSIVTFLMVSVMAFADGGNIQQMQLRLEIIKYLSDEGIKTSIDSAGVVFTIDNKQMHYIINTSYSDKDPLIVTLYSESLYGENDSQENVQKCIDLVNKLNVVKLYCNDLAYSYRADVLCKDVQMVKTSFRPLLEQFRKAVALVDLVMSSELRGIDLVTEKDRVCDYALDLYAKGDYEEAVCFLDYLSESGFEQAYGFLGLAYEEGKGVERNDDKMIYLYNQAVRAGYNWCAYHLGRYYEEGREYDLAMKNYVQCSANEGTYRSAAFYSIGRLYEKGIGVSVDMANAVKYYQKSVQYSTVLESEARLALIRLGEIVDPLESFVNATSAKLKGLTPEDMFRIGVEFESGMNGRYVSLPEAYSYILASADEGYPKAMIKLGDIYVNEYYPFNDTNKSNRYYQKAIKVLKKTYESDGEACYELGCMLYNGKGIEKDVETANALFRTGAEKGNPESSYMAGLQFLGDLDYPEAYKYFKRAAEAGVGLAMFELAKLYESGHGVRYDGEEAIKWYQKCYASKCEKSDEAGEALKKMNNRDGKYE